MGREALDMVLLLLEPSVIIVGLEYGPASARQPQVENRVPSKTPLDGTRFIQFCWIHDVD